MLNAALRSLDGLAEQVTLLAIRNQIPFRALQLLLRHHDDAVAGQAAIGTWNADPKGQILDSLRDDWREAVLRCHANEFWLGEIFSKDAPLAFEWLKRQFERNESSLHLDQHATNSAIEVISSEHRSQLIRAIPEDFWNVDVLTELIGPDMGLYSEFLADDRVSQLHMAPLAGPPNKGNWVEKAKCALSHGHSIEKIANAVLHDTSVWWGNDSDRWKERIEAFEAIRGDPDERIQQVAESGLAYARGCYESALEQERMEETYGRP